MTIQESERDLVSKNNFYLLKWMSENSHNICVSETDYYKISGGFLQTCVNLKTGAWSHSCVLPEIINGKWRLNKVEKPVEYNLEQAVYEATYKNKKFTVKGADDTSPCLVLRKNDRGYASIFIDESEAGFIHGDFKTVWVEKKS